MRPHPAFADRRIPTEHVLGLFRLKALTVDDLDRDFDAVMESAAEINATNPSLIFPKGLTRDKNLIDLAWHQKEFRARPSIAWVIEDKSRRPFGTRPCLPVHRRRAGGSRPLVVAHRGHGGSRRVSHRISD